MFFPRLLDDVVPLQLMNEPFKQVPDNNPQRLAIRNRVRETVARLERQGKQPSLVNRQMLESLAQQILGELGFSVDYTAWTMVLLGNEFWRESIEAIPPNRRVLLLPHCMRKSPGCPGIYEKDGLLCQSCGSCPLGDLKTLAESLGYHLLIAEGTPIVMQWILNGKADAILGVGCLHSLERAFEKIQFAGIPAAAVPLWGSTCKNSLTDLDWIREMIDIPYKPRVRTVQRAVKGGTLSHSADSNDSTGNDSENRLYSTLHPTWLHLLRGATRLFDEMQLRELLSPVLPVQSFSVEQEQKGSKNDGMSTDYLGMTGRIAFDFLRRGGKHYRPFITLAAYDALTGSLGTGEDGAEIVARFPNSLKRIAISMEIFHKASLVHDDIEDDDAFRYGLPSLHQAYGIPSAINIGDYLIGLGYRLIASQSRELSEKGGIEEGGIIVADILQKLSEAHTKLCEGQGGELTWRLHNSGKLPSQEQSNRELSAVETLRIYGLKTSPAFEAALYAGLRFGAMSARLDLHWFRSLEPLITQFSRFLGIAFQIKNDLEDWDWDNAGKREYGADILGGRPTLLRALAFESLDQSDQVLFQELLQGLQQIDGLQRLYTDERNQYEQNEVTNHLKDKMGQVRRLYEKANVFSKASQLIGKYADRARTVVEQIDHESLKPLLLHFVHSLLGTAVS
ncbi:MAG: polyprenyl synthetase family protein [Thermoguttaceae bacterium]